MRSNSFFHGIILTLVTLMNVEGQRKRTGVPRIWNIAIGNEWAGHEYIDSEGYVIGFSIDFIDQVCDIGEMDCRIIVDEYHKCWTDDRETKAYFGGLMRRRYDACTGWTATVHRIHQFAFSMAYINLQTSHFYVLKGQIFDPENIAGKKIGFLLGWSAGAECVAREDKIKGFDEKIKVVYKLPHQAMEGLRRGAVDALFGTDDYWEKADLVDLHKPPLDVKCLLAGNSMMSRKDSHFTANWNSAFFKFRDTAKYLRFCEETNRKHGHRGTVSCNIGY